MKKLEKIEMQNIVGGKSEPPACDGSMNECGNVGDQCSYDGHYPGRCNDYRCCLPA